MTQHEQPLLGDGVHVDVQTLIDGRALIQANSGGGKSYAIRKLCEITYGHAQQIILDVEGEFYTLREKYDYVLAGKDGDCPATVESAAILARRLLELGTSCIVDIYELGAKRAQFTAHFIDAIMSAPRALWHDLILVVDEANKFCPEDTKERNATRGKDIHGKEWNSAESIIDLMTRGRKRGFCGVLATQRLSALDKNAAAECNNVLIGRCTLDVDIDRAAKRMGMKSVVAQNELPMLAAGMFYAMGPAFEIDWAVSQRVAKIQVGTVVTTHPKRGQKVPIPPPRAMVKKALAQLGGIAEEAAQEAKTIDELRALVAKLTSENIRSKDVRALQVEEHAANEYRSAWEADHQELEGLHQRIEKLARLFRAPGQGVNIDTLDEDVHRMHAALRAYQYFGTEMLKLKQLFVDTFDSINVKRSDIENQRTNGVPHGARAVGKLTGETFKPNLPKRPRMLMSMDERISPALQRVIDTIALLERLGIPPTIEGIAAWYGSHPNSKGFRNYISALRSQGFLDGLRLNDEGHRVANRITLPTRDEVRARVLEPLAPALQRIMKIVLDHGPVSVEELAQAYGAHPNSKGFRNYVSILRTRGLLTDGWPVTTTPVLHLERA